ncbi:unnamed protein product, partial [Amoebophrya sp. A120]
WRCSAPRRSLNVFARRSRNGKGAASLCAPVRRHSRRAVGFVMDSRWRACFFGGRAKAAAFGGDLDEDTHRATMDEGAGPQWQQGRPIVSVVNTKGPTASKAAGHCEGGAE